MTARDVSRREIKEEMEDGGAHGGWRADQAPKYSEALGRCDNKSIVVTELCNRHRRPGESLRALATDIETLTRRAYGHMPPAVLSEYARDQFVRAIEPRDLRERVQLRHPSTLQEALELALEREELRDGTTQGGVREASPTVRVAVESSPAREQPEWVGAMMERMTELVRAVTLQPQGGNFCYVPSPWLGAVFGPGGHGFDCATLMRPDVVPVGTQLEQTSVQLRTVTDFLKFARCLLDLGENTVSFPGGPTVKMISPPLPSRSAPLAVRTTEIQIHSASPLASHGSSRPLNARPRCSPAYSTAERSSPIPPAPDSQLTSPAGSTPLSPSAAPFTPGAPRPLAQPNMEEEADRLAVVRGIWERSCGHLEPEQQEELWQLLTEFKGIFALTDAEIGRTHLVHHQIDTGDARPIRSPPRRLPMAYREAAECAIDEMQHASIIEPSASPWASGVVMVKRKTPPK
ncbi:hypothetical protein AAFF_G00334390 [Aldrovandia affinis]|uniref:Uncharacterized protein n=1 Tax=Aldrovandia affinis TaxID=143900 RepID=A0AAD7WPG2_9TELE|nr:hypothetical protein AAFF_G00334390 [Aldrovandia affinis]